MQLNEFVKIITQDPEDTNQSPSLRADALFELVQAGAQSIPALLEGLSSPHIIYLSRAFVDIGSSGIPALVNILDTDSDPIRRANAAYILGKMGATAAVETLMHALKDEQMEVRKQAANAFNFIQDEEAVLVLCQVLEDPEPEVRGSAALALGAQKDTRAIEALKQVYLQDDDEDVRRVAHTALRQLGYNPDDAESLIVPVAESRVMPLLSDAVDPMKPDTMGIPRVELLLATLESSDLNVQRRARRELVRLGDKAVLPLIAALSSENAGLRAHAAWVLGEIGDPRALGQLQVTCNDSDEDVRYASQQAIGKIQGQ